MKADIHPAVYQAKVTCASCGNTWTTTSTKKELRIDICSKCHPFFSGEAARIIDIEGQVDRFYKKLSARQTYVETQKIREEGKNSPDRSVEDLGLSPRATEALKRAGLLTIGQFLARLAEGDPALLTIHGFAQSALTNAKKKLRAMGFEIPAAPSAPAEDQA
jgi:large subunit ribosomal protein L31